MDRSKSLWAVAAVLGIVAVALAIWAWGMVDGVNEFMPDAKRLLADAERMSMLVWIGAAVAAAGAIGAGIGAIVTKPEAPAG